MDFSLTPRCRGCLAEAAAFEEVLSLVPMPLAGVFCQTLEEARHASVYPLTWVRCRKCGLTQVREDIPDRVLFSQYNYASSSVGGLVRHFEGYAEVLTQRYSREAGIHFLEIGCNDGVLLRRLPAHWRKTGVDPSDVAARAAQSQQAYELLQAPFSPGLVREAKLEGKVEVISGSNCLAHISNLFEVFAAVELALKPGGHFWLEVHDLAALLRDCQWDTIYHEHKAEWSQASLCRCLALHGFEHLETTHLPLHGGALRSLFRKAGGAPATLASPAPAEPEFAALRKAYETRYESAAVRALAACQRRGGCLAAYGAAGRANVYLNQLPELRFAYIVDESPLRVNKFIPRVATPIVSPRTLLEQPAEACLITAWNYRTDIIAKNPGHTGAWLTAFGQ